MEEIIEELLFRLIDQKPISKLLVSAAERGYTISFEKAVTMAPCLRVTIEETRKVANVPARRLVKVIDNVYLLEG